MYLNYDLSTCHREMVHARVEIGKASCWECHHFVFDKAIPHADLECPRNYGHIFLVVDANAVESELAREEVTKWRVENPSNKYAIYFAPQPAMLTGDFKEAEPLLDEALRLIPDEPLIISLQGVFCALTGKTKRATECLTRACATPKSFGHAHHTYYQIACILAVLNQPKAAFEWLERSVDTGFACWPFFLMDPCLQNLRSFPEMEAIVAALQAKYPDHLGLL
jgi:hypothetical protein